MLWSLSCSCAIVCACISGGHGDDVVEEKDVMKNEEDSLAVHGVVDNKEKGRLLILLSMLPFIITMSTFNFITGFSLLKLVIARNNNKDTRMEIKSCSSLLEGMQSIKSFFRFGNHVQPLSPYFFVTPYKWPSSLLKQCSVFGKKVTFVKVSKNTVDIFFWHKYLHGLFINVHGSELF